MIPITILTNDNHIWATRPFAHLFNMMWDIEQPVEVVGFNRPGFELPSNFHFYSISKTNYPANRWTNGLIEYLKAKDFKYFILMLEDYWLTGPVHIIHVDSTIKLIKRTDNVLRVDLTADRASKKQARYFCDIGGVKVIKTPPHTPYQMSFQAAVWNRELLLEVLVNNETPWQAEIEGSKRLAKRDDLIVLGTTSHPVKYVPVLRRNKVGLQNFHKIPRVLREAVLPLLPKGRKWV